MSVIERKRGGGPSGNRKESAVKRAEVINLRLAGNTLEVVAERVGLSVSGVKYHEDAWLAERTPTAEVTEHRRQVQLAAIDHVKARLFEALGEVDELALRLAVVDRIEKLWNREARLAGLDLERNVSINILPTAEQFAAALGWAGDDVVEGSATELPAGDDA